MKRTYFFCAGFESVFHGLWTYDECFFSIRVINGVDDFLIDSWKTVRVSTFVWRHLKDTEISFFLRLFRRNLCNDNEDIFTIDCTNLKTVIVVSWRPVKMPLKTLQKILICVGVREVMGIGRKMSQKFNTLYFGKPLHRAQAVWYTNWGL